MIIPLLETPVALEENLSEIMQVPARSHVARRVCRQGRGSRA